MAGSPWTNQAINLIILTEQTTGFSGMFGYSPTVGHGNLIFSVAAAAGVDPYGNSYPQGVSSVVGQITANSLTVGELMVNSGPLLVYTSANAGGQVFAAGSSGNWTAPANVTSVTATLIAGGGNGSTYAGGSGAECAVQTFTVVPGHNYAYSVGNAGQPTTFNGITANPGQTWTGSGGAPAGGSGSNATAHYNGGAGYLFSGFTDFGAGGSSAGPTQPGNAGSGETGGAAVPGGGAGGSGGNPGSAGGTPGGGGGGLNDQSGGGGQLTLSYTGSGSSVNDVLLLAISAVAGTDSFGNTYGTGLTLASTGAPAAPAAGCILYYSGGSLYAVGPSNTPVLIATT